MHSHLARLAQGAHVLPAIPGRMRSGSSWCACSEGFAPLADRMLI